MTDLDDTVVRHLHEQPPVSTPPLAVIRQRAARRRQRTAGQWAVAAGVTAVAAAVIPSFTVSENRDVASPTSPALVPSGVTRAQVCPAWPYNGGRRHCASGSDPAVIRELTDLMNADRPATEATACRPGDRETPNVRLRFVTADGSASVLRVVDCLLTADGSDRLPVYAPDVARLAATWLSDWVLPADGSDREGCAAVVEDLTALAAHIPADWPPLPQDAVLPASVAEGTITEERPYLDRPQQAIVDSIYPQINSLLLGYSPDGSSPDRVILNGLADLQALCPTAK